MESEVSTSKRTSKKQPSECKICGASALYSSFGATVCPSCKIFFRRNAHPIKQLKCHFDGHCGIDMNTRHTCAYCRLAKCFANGMQTELIQGSENTKSKSTISTVTKAYYQTAQLNIVNILQANQAVLNKIQWRLLSNLTHCYDEYSGFSFVKDYLREQNQLPLKMRFKTATVDKICTLLTAGAQLLYEKNSDFVSLYSYDRSLLINNTIKYTMGLSSSFISHHSYLFDYPSFCQSLVTVYGLDTFFATYRAVRFLNFDKTFVKLILAILIFSTFDYVTYTSQAPKNLSNIKLILNIQDRYIELTWRYLLYRFDYEQAVICFSNLIRCIFLVNAATVAAIDCQNYINMVDSLVEQTERTLSSIE